MKKLFTTYFALLFAVSFVNGQDTNSVFKDGEKNKDFAPHISYSGDSLILQSNRNGGNALFLSSLKDDGQWTKPKALSSINNGFKGYKLMGGPSLTQDGKTLYFCAYKEEHNMDIFMVEKSGDSWGKAQQLPDIVNTNGFEGFPGISPDGKTLFFQKRDLNNKSGIYYTTKSDSTWSAPQLLALPTNYSNPKAPEVFYDNKGLIFAAKTNGNYDLFFLKDYTNPSVENIAPLDFVNTDNDEHYATFGPESMIYDAGTELKQAPLPFKYRRVPYLELASLIQDVDLKTPLDAIYQLYDADSNMISSGEVQSTKGEKVSYLLKGGAKYSIAIFHPSYDKYSEVLDLTELKEYTVRETPFELEHRKQEFVINVSDAETKEGIKVEFSIENLDLDEDINFDDIVVRDGKYVISLREGNNYNIEVNSQEGYAYTKSKVKVPVTFDDESMDVLSKSRGSESEDIQALIARLDSIVQSRIDPEGKNRVDESTTNTVDIAVKPLHVGTQLDLNDIYFDFSSAKLKEESFIELDKVVELMSANPKMKIEIAAHTDNVGRDQYNYLLSLKRAQSIVEYLINKNVPKSKLVSKGYGEKKPIATNDTEEGRAKNRRVELIVLNFRS